MSMGCEKAPDGWQCTREHGHEGSCAARMAEAMPIDRNEIVIALMTNILAELQMMNATLNAGGLGEISG